MDGRPKGVPGGHGVCFLGSADDEEETTKASHPVGDTQAA